MKIKKCLCSLLIVQIFTCSFAKAEAPRTTSEFNLQEVTLPSELKELGKQNGSIFYSAAVKNKVLIPVHIWGEVKFSGLHFIPADTTLIKGLSLAGGPNTAANLENILVTRAAASGKQREIKFDLSEGGDQTAHQFKIEAGDTIFVRRDTFVENRAYYTTLVGILVTIISTFVVVKKID